MEQCGAEYIGEMSLDDPAFCREIFEVLIQHLGEQFGRLARQISALC
jgi:hypothetical protein